VLADPGREEALRGCNVPLTVVNVGKLENLPGGGAKISLVQVLGFTPYPTPASLHPMSRKINS